MSESEKTHSGLTRRGFLKVSSVAAGTALAVGGAGSLTAAADGYSAGRADNDGELIFRGVCRPNCFGYCHLNVHVREGNIVKTSRAPYASNRAYDRICQRGLSHVQRIYDPDRLRYPLRRVEGTERGAGQWERISWDEAAQTIADKINECQTRYGKQAFAYTAGSGNASACHSNTYGRLWNLLEATNIYNDADLASLYGANRMCGPLTQMWDCNELTDMINAKHIVLIGSNITDAQIHHWHFVKEAMRNGATLTVIDPTFTQVASKADDWVPIRPGTDTALYMGLSNIFFEKDAVDVAFMNERTCGPFLVHPETKKFVRASDIGGEPVFTGEINPMTGEEIVYDPYLVVQEGGLVAYDKASDPQLDAEVEYNGLKFRTSFALLKDEVDKFSPDVVSEITDIPSEKLYQIAELYMDGPVTTYVGFGGQAYMNGTHTTHAGMIMSALVGNLGKPGASYGTLWHAFFYGNGSYGAPLGANPTPQIESVDFPNILRSGMYRGEAFHVKMLYVYDANPISTAPDTNVWLNDILPRLDFMVVADSQMTDTASYADIVLPIAQWFEVEDITMTGSTLAISYNEKAIEPPYECKSDPDIVRLIADKLGLGEYFELTDEEVLADFFESDYCRSAGITFDKVKELGDMRFCPDEPHIAWSEENPFTTASGRFEFYLENPTPRAVTTKEIPPEMYDRERLPHWFPPNEAWPENEIMQKYPFVLMSVRGRFRVHSQWYNVKMLRELDPEPTVSINPADAAARRIADGDYVECFNDRGHAVAKAVLSEGVRPGTLVYPKSWQRGQHKAGSWSELLSMEFDPFTVNANFMDVACDIRMWSEGDE